MIRTPDTIFTDTHGKEFQEKEHLFALTVNDGDIHQFAAGHISSHWHKELEIFLLLEGCVRAGIADRICRLNAGEGCFINTEVIHSFTAETARACRYRSFVFSSDIIAGTPGSIFDTAYVRPVLENGIPYYQFQKENGDDYYFEQFEHAFTACTAEPYGYEFQVRNALSNILLYVKSKNPGTGERRIPPVQEARLKEMLLWIDRHLDSHITVSEIAASANICTRECQRIFHHYLHYSPMEYLQRKRIFYAARLLSDTARPVTDIALQCGFSNPGYFSMQFRRLMDAAPSEYRAAVRKSFQKSGPAET